MTKEILTKEQIKSELDRGRKRLFPISVSCFLLCFILAGVGVALTVSLAGEYKEYKEKVLFFYIYIVTSLIITLIGLYGACVMGKGIFEILFGKWHNRDIIITRDEVSRMVDDETISRYDYYNQLKEKHFGFYRDSSIRHQENILYFYRCGRYVANSTVFGYTSVGDEFYLISYADDPERPILIYSTKIYEIKE